MTRKRVAVIVGYGPGIGASVAAKLLDEGYDLGILSRDAAIVDHAAALAKGGRRVIGQVADAGVTPSLTTALQAVIDGLGPVSVLHYNAAAVRPGHPTELTAEDLLADLAVSVAGVLTAVRGVAPDMLAARSGTILLTGGGFAIRPAAALASLGVGKAALRNLAQSLAEELTPQGIRVGTVTVLGQVERGGPLDPDRIAEQLLRFVHDHERRLPFEIRYPD